MIDLIAAIDSVKFSSKSELSSRFFGRLKFSVRFEYLGLIKVLKRGDGSGGGRRGSRGRSRGHGHGHRRDRAAPAAAAVAQRQCTDESVAAEEKRFCKILTIFQK